jgi:hypothetical protein
MFFGTSFKPSRSEKHGRIVFKPLETCCSLRAQVSRSRTSINVFATTTMAPKITITKTEPIEALKVFF